MKTMLLAATILGTAVATPALAQTRVQDEWRPYGYEQGYSAYGSRYGMSPSYRAYSPRGYYRGTDPDPRVRDQIRRDPTQGD
jgi:hypothetical protein